MSQRFKHKKVYLQPELENYVHVHNISAFFPYHPMLQQQLIAERWRPKHMLQPCITRFTAMNRNLLQRQY